MKKNTNTSFFALAPVFLVTLHFKDGIVFLLSMKSQSMTVINAIKNCNLLTALIYIYI